MCMLCGFGLGLALWQHTLTASRPLLATTVVCPRDDSSLAATFWFMRLSSTNNTDAVNRGVVERGTNANDARSRERVGVSGCRGGVVGGVVTGELRGEVLGSDVVVDACIAGEVAGGCIEQLESSKLDCNVLASPFEIAGGLLSVEEQVTTPSLLSGDEPESVESCTSSPESTNLVPASALLVVDVVVGDAAVVVVGVVGAIIVGIVGAVDAIDDCDCEDDARGAIKSSSSGRVFEKSLLRVCGNRCNRRSISLWSVMFACANSSVVGSVTFTKKPNVDPWPSSLSTQILPPSSSTSLREIASPRPVPP